jgi:hypothetical protein
VPLTCFHKVCHFKWPQTYKRIVLFSQKLKQQHFCRCASAMRFVAGRCYRVGRGSVSKRLKAKVKAKPMQRPKWGWKAVLEQYFG